MAKIVWIDMEMSGLNVLQDRILEIACIITDDQLNIIAEHPSIVVHQPDSLLDAMDTWCLTTHTKTGLMAECKRSTVTEQQAEDAVINFLIANGVTESSSPLAGNSIHMDRMFLRLYMKRLDAHLHYRIIDVSSVKELCKRWNPVVYAQVPAKQLAHRGLQDIRDSIEEAKYYKKFMFLSEA